MLINNIIKFLITAFVLFLVIKAYNKTKKDVPAPAPSDEVVLLTEIRDALKR
jgi:large conductance mechanosensitive channel